MVSIEELKEQIEFYIDQLDLLGMQKEKDQVRMAETTEIIASLAQQYLEILNSNVEEKIKEIQSKPVDTLQALLQKRQDIFLIVQNRANLVEELFLSREHTEQLINRIQPMIQFVQSEAKFYRSDVELVEQQLSAMKEADKKEEDLKRVRDRYQMEAQLLRNKQMSCADLNQEILASYQEVLNNTKQYEMNFTILKNMKEGFEKQQQKLQENLDLAKGTKEGAVFQEEYEKKLKKTRLEHDKACEQIFLHFLKKIISIPVSSYGALQDRTDKISQLINARKREITQLYNDGVVTKEEYTSVAFQFDHSKAIQQQEDREKIAELDNLVKDIEEQLEHTRDHIKGKAELEEIFENKVKEPFVVDLSNPEAQTQLGVTPDFTDDFDTFEEMTFAEMMTDKENRRRVVSVGTAPADLINRIQTKAKKALILALTAGSLFSSLVSVAKASEPLFDAEEPIETVSIQSLENEAEPSTNTGEEEILDIDSNTVENSTDNQKYNPSIGDKIHLNNGSKIYSSSINAISGVEAYDAIASGLGQNDLYVTRGAIIDKNGTLVYITSQYGNNLEEVAKNIGLEEGTYNIALGCSSGGASGEFIEVSENQLNPSIEKGWINATDPNLVVVSKMSDVLEKGGMLK